MIKILYNNLVLCYTDDEEFAKDFAAEIEGITLERIEL